MSFYIWYYRQKKGSFFLAVFAYTKNIRIFHNLMEFLTMSRQNKPKIHKSNNFWLTQQEIHTKLAFKNKSVLRVPPPEKRILFSGA
jgi:hypothetical protein